MQACGTYSFILAIDGFMGREDAVIKSLDDFRPKGVAGVTTLSNGKIVLILDMKEESDLERTEPASSRRLEQAREEGNVPQSRELMAFMVLAAGAGAFWVLGGWLSQRTSGLLRHGLSFSREAAFDTSLMTGWALSLTTEAFVIAAPIFLLAMAAAIVTPFMIGGGVISPKAFQLDLNRMDPIKGLGRMFSWQSIAELVKAILKALLIGGVLYWVVRHEQNTACLPCSASPLKRPLFHSPRFCCTAFWRSLPAWP
jgi:flagellar biosynthetic protein FlhB